jgi:mediator of RNA polymerase II transcription subunit 7
MADQDPQAGDVEPQLLSYFPSPPPFYKNFTAENVARLKSYKQEKGIEDEEDGMPTHMTAEQQQELPVELRFMVPPKPPGEEEEFRVFNEVTKVSRPLAMIDI